MDLFGLLYYDTAKVFCCAITKKRLSSAHAFNYIVLRVTGPGLTSCKELTTALLINDVVKSVKCLLGKSSTTKHSTEAKLHE